MYADDTSLTIWSGDPLKLQSKLNSEMQTQKDHYTDTLRPCVVGSICTAHLSPVSFPPENERAALLPRAVGNRA